MSDMSSKFDEEVDNPFDLMEMLGWSTSDEDEEEEGDYFEGGDWDDDESLDWTPDIFWANYLMFSSRFGDWGQFANGLTCDGSREVSDADESDELSLFEHVRLVMDMRSEARRDSQGS